MLLGNTNEEYGYYKIPAFANGIVPTTQQVVWFLLESFTCPNSYEASRRRDQNVPVWQYRYFGDWDNVRLYPDSGAYHGSDLHMIFGASGDVSGIAPSEAEKQTTQLMQHAWAAFCNDPTNGLTKVMNWPKFDPNQKSLIRLAYQNNPKPDFVKPETYDSPCSTITMGALSTATAT